MTIQEAIKTGKPFKTPRQPDWIVVSQPHELIFVYESSGAIFQPTPMEICGENWGIKPEQEEKP